MKEGSRVQFVGFYREGNKTFPGYFQNNTEAPEAIEVRFPYKHAQGIAATLRTLKLTRFILDYNGFAPDAAEAKVVQEICKGLPETGIENLSVVMPRGDVGPFMRLFMSFRNLNSFELQGEGKSNLKYAGIYAQILQGLKVLKVSHVKLRSLPLYDTKGFNQFLKYKCLEILDLTHIEFPTLHKKSLRLWKPYISRAGLDSLIIKGCHFDDTFLLGFLASKTSTEIKSAASIVYYTDFIALVPIKCFHLLQITEFTLKNQDELPSDITLKSMFAKIEKSYKGTVSIAARRVYGTTLEESSLQVERFKALMQHARKDLNIVRR